MMAKHRLPTIFSVNQGRTIVAAMDGCEMCIDALRDFVEERMRKHDDRLIVALYHNRTSWRSALRVPRAGKPGPSDELFTFIDSIEGGEDTDGSGRGQPTCSLSTDGEDTDGSDRELTNQPPLPSPLPLTNPLSSPPFRPFADSIKDGEDTDGSDREQALKELMTATGSAGGGGHGPSVSNVSTIGTGTAVIDEATAPVLLKRLKWDGDAKQALSRLVGVSIEKKVRFEVALLDSKSVASAVVNFCDMISADVLVLATTRGISRHEPAQQNTIQKVLSKIGHVSHTELAHHCSKNAPCAVVIISEHEEEDEEEDG
ncbi:unnamed protein product [Closterium sp. Naga37s-1]|nr:unnamed protein product [Closterium sp. Naga37s-1]